MFSKIKKKIDKNLRERKQRHRNLKNMPAIIREQLAVQHLTHLSLMSSTSLTSNHKLTDNEIIVSFTTYNKRIHDVYLVLESIALQTVKPNQVILWLDQDEFSLETIPLSLKSYIKRGLQVEFCENYKSYKKIIPTLLKHPTSNIITVDDDIIYPHDMIEILAHEHQRYPEYIIGHRAHEMKSENGQYLNYKQWVKNTENSNASHDIFLTGCGGIFYPCHSLHADVNDDSLFMALCPHADDIWLKFMAIKNDTVHKKVDDQRDFDSRFVAVKSSQDIGLNKQNVDNNQNDVQLKKLLEYLKLDT